MNLLFFVVLSFMEDSGWGTATGTCCLGKGGQRRAGLHQKPDPGPLLSVQSLLLVIFSRVSLEKKADKPGVVNFSEARVGLNIDDLLYWQLGGCRGTCCTFVRQVRKDVGTCTCAVCL